MIERWFAQGFGVVPAGMDGSRNGAGGVTISNAGACDALGLEGMKQCVLGPSRCHQHNRCCGSRGCYFGEDACQGDLSRRNRGDRLVGLDLHAEAEEVLLDHLLFKRGLGIGGDDGCGGDERDGIILAAQQFGQNTAHIIMVVVKDRDSAGFGAAAGHQIIRREDIAPRRNRYRRPVVAAGAVSQPMRTGGKDDVIGAQFRNGFRRHAAFEIERDIGQLVDLSQAPIPHAAPGGEAGQAAFPGDAAAGLGGLLRDGHLIAALAQGAAGLKA